MRKPQHGMAGATDTGNGGGFRDAEQFYEARVDFDYDAVERALSPGAEKPEPAQPAYPNDDRTVQMMVRLMSWILFGKKADKIIMSAVVKRSIVTGYAVNPDFFDGKKLAHLAKDIGCEKESLYAFARDFTREFGIPVHNSSSERVRLNVRKKADATKDPSATEGQRKWLD